jgi:hypothetical protein
LNPRTFDSVIEALEDRVADLELKVTPNSSSPSSSSDNEKVKTLVLPAKNRDNN